MIYHFVPTGLETAQRAVSPKDAPEVEGDTWSTKKQPVSQGTDGHGPPSHDGDDLRAPVSPTAGVKYANLWAQQSLSNPDVGTVAREAVPAVQETVRRTLTPTEQAPPVKNDSWTDKRPEDNSGAVVLVPGKTIKPVADLTDQLGKKVTGPLLDGISGEHDDKH